jgi:hypothetical protein
MRKFVLLVVVVAAVVVLFGAKSFFGGRTADHSGLVANTMEASKTLSPHEIHLNYKSMKELPVHEVKEPF